MNPRKHSRKPLYARAFTLFAGGKSLAEISAETGLAEHLLAACAESQNWQKRRALLVGSRSVAAAETRIQAQIAVDSTLVDATRQAAGTLAAAYVRLIEEAAALPTHPFAAPDGTKPDANEQYRQERAMIEAKAETMRKATEGLRELIDTAQNVGLLKVERGGKAPGGTEDDKPIDLAKLTQLNIAIVQATNGSRPQVVAQLTEAQPARAEPIPVSPAA